MWRTPARPLSAADSAPLFPHSGPAAAFLAPVPHLQPRPFLACERRWGAAARLAQQHLERYGGTPRERRERKGKDSHSRAFPVLPKRRGSPWSAGGERGEAGCRRATPAGVRTSLPVHTFCCVCACSLPESGAEPRGRESGKSPPCSTERRS